MILHDRPLYFVFLLPISLLAFKLKGSRMLEDIHLRRFEIKAENPLILLGKKHQPLHLWHNRHPCVIF